DYYCSSYSGSNTYIF
nr:immunoglobulin light chain junction region [Macaca mulatta]MOV94447.1 immunoglobulin light chain junction region [Macaca mulatta]MOV94570.1 immunoglobulin light chain junction region [Macaca mulatta]MOV94851.1 immunoglobulin light chain junction region [Macaca mulatta]MOV95272.1 immunoglobulin light chain junction region [Macaca mulatta]